MLVAILFSYVVCYIGMCLFAGLCYALSGLGMTPLAIATLLSGGVVWIVCISLKMSKFEKYYAQKAQRGW